MAIERVPNVSLTVEDLYCVEEDAALIAAIESHRQGEASSVGGSIELEEDQQSTAPYSS